MRSFMEPLHKVFEVTFYKLRVFKVLNTCKQWETRTLHIMLKGGLSTSKHK